jgi:alpha-tubulin suppressor-like RCC1 family protein
LGDTTDRNTPTKVTGLANVMQLAAGEYHSLALHNDGAVSAFGRNYDGQ